MQVGVLKESTRATGIESHEMEHLLNPLPVAHVEKLRLDSLRLRGSKSSIPLEDHEEVPHFCKHVDFIHKSSLRELIKVK